MDAVYLICMAAQVGRCMLMDDGFVGYWTLVSPYVGICRQGAERAGHE